MMRKYFIIFFALTVIIASIGLTPHAEVVASHSASSADPWVNGFRLNGCNGLFSNPGPGQTVARCNLPAVSPFRNFTIQVPYPRVFSTNPTYGLAGVPFGIGLDWNPNTAGFIRYSSNPRTYTIGRDVRFHGFNAYAILSPVNTGTTFHAASSYSLGNDSANDNVRIFKDGDIPLKVSGIPIDAIDVTTDFLADAGFAIEGGVGGDFGGLDRGLYISTNMAEELDGETIVPAYSLENYAGVISGAGLPVYIRTGNNDPSHYLFITGLSSYNSSSGDSIDGEPAYGVAFRTTWYLYSKVEWDSYDAWKVVGEECEYDIWGNEIPGSCEDVYNWVRDGGSYSTEWIYNGSTIIEEVFDARTGQYVDRVPFLVYQAQVLMEN